MITIRYFSPAPELRSYISSYYWFESDLPVFRDMMRAELPQIRFTTVGSATNRYCDGKLRRSGRAQLQGPTNGPVHFHAVGPLHLFGVGLLPLGWASLIGAPADEHADDAVDLAGVVEHCIDGVVDAMARARYDAARVLAADRFFLGLLDCARSVPVWFTRLTDDWLTATPNPDVDALVAASGMSARSVERLARRIYGAPPKLLARKYRALNAAVRLGNGEVDNWAEAADGIYYDQAHFIRDFKQFIGMTPARFQQEAAPVTKLTIARKKLMPDLPPLALYS